MLAMILSRPYLSPTPQDQLIHMCMFPVPITAQQPLYNHNSSHVQGLAHRIGRPEGLDQVVWPTLLYCFSHV